MRTTGRKSKQTRQTKLTDKFFNFLTLNYKYKILNNPKDFKNNNLA